MLPCNFKRMRTETLGESCYLLTVPKCLLRWAISTWHAHLGRSLLRHLFYQDHQIYCSSLHKAERLTLTSFCRLCCLPMIYKLTVVETWKEHESSKHSPSPRATSSLSLTTLELQLLCLLQNNFPANLVFNLTAQSKLLKKAQLGLYGQEFWNLRKMTQENVFQLKNNTSPNVFDTTGKQKKKEKKALR